MQSRYRQMFEDLRIKSEGAFIPFVVLGDPDPATSLEIVRSLVLGGADALELGIAFSDPVADGPTIQRSDMRALAAGTRPKHAFSITHAIRSEFPKMPIGLLVYANLVHANGISNFYRTAQLAGVDSVLVADVPVIEALPYTEAAWAQGVEPVLIATSNSGSAHLKQIAKLSRGYTYVVTRAGVTGADDRASTQHGQLLATLDVLSAPPCVLGFGISRPEHVEAAIRSGAAGVISGSAVVQRLEQHLENLSVMLSVLGDFVAEMKAATRFRSP